MVLAITTQPCYMQLMSSNARAVHEEPHDAPSRDEAAGYIFELSKQLAGMAEKQGMSRLAAALEQARGLAAEELATLAIQSRAGKAAPEDAA